MANELSGGMHSGHTSSTNPREYMPWSGKTRPNVHEGHGELLRHFSGMGMHVGTCLTTPRHISTPHLTSLVTLDTPPAPVLLFNLPDRELDPERGYGMGLSFASELISARMHLA